MKNIICYGDSNTFGYNTLDASRYDEKTRWTALLQTALGNNYKIIEEGVCDRTGFVDNPKGSLYSAQRHFPEMLSISDDIYLIIIALGTNDLQFQYGINFETVKKGLEILIQTALKKTKNIILIPPVILDEKVLEGSFSFQFDSLSIKKSKEIGEIYEQLAENYKCKIFDVNNITKPSDADGLHYDSKSHKIIADNLSVFIKNII